MEKLSFNNFFSNDYIIKPWSRDLSPKDQKVAWAATILLGILTGGLLHLGFGIRYALQGRVQALPHDVTGTGKKTSTVAENLLPNPKQKLEKPAERQAGLHSLKERGLSEQVNAEPSISLPKEKAGQEGEQKEPEKEQPEKKENMPSLEGNGLFRSVNAYPFSFSPEKGIEQEERVTISLLSEIKLTPYLEQLYGKSLGYAASGQHEPEKKDSNKLSIKELTLEFVNFKLSEIGKVPGKAIDNGDCFFHAFAQGLNFAMQRQNPFTVSELRQMLFDKVSKIPSYKDSWKFSDYSYEEYIKEIKNDGSGQHAPLWGSGERDGAILCKACGVNLKVFMAEIPVDSSDGSFENPFLPDESEEERINYYRREGILQGEQGPTFGLQTKISEGEDRPTIEMIVFRNHFVPVFDREALEKQSG